MKLPKSITILGQKFKLEEKTLEKIAKIVGPNTMGAVNYSERRILIGSDIDEIDKELVAFHEFFHCIMLVSGLSQSFSPEIQEVVAESFANGIIEILKQLDKANPRGKQLRNGRTKKNKMRKVLGAQKRNS